MLIKNSTAKQGYRYYKLRKVFFPKFYRRHYELISRQDAGLNLLLLQGLSEPELYGDLVCKFRKFLGKPVFSVIFVKES